MDTYGNRERTICFSPEKHLLQFKHSDTIDIFITDHTSVKEVEPRFPKSDMQAEFFTISTIIKGKGGNDNINLKGLQLDTNWVFYQRSSTDIENSKIVR